MSSKRGRKRNDNLPPNRARDVQRAFRARRAAHLIAMEERVAELEEENDRLRAALNMPPANRPTLGKGPTGKDKPKGRGYDTQPSSSGEPSTAHGEMPISRATSSASSTRDQSISPSASNGLHPSPPNVETSGWQDIMAQEGAGTNAQPSPTSGTFSPPTSAYSHSPGSTPFAPVSPSFASTSTSAPYTPNTGQNGGGYSLASSQAQQSQKVPPSPYSFAPSHVQSSSSRPPLAGTVYMNYPPASGQSYLEPPHSYTASPISPHDTNGIHGQPPQNSLQSLVHPPHGNVSFPQRRSHTEPHGYRPLGNHHGYLATQPGAPPRMVHGGSGEARLNPI